MPELGKVAYEAYANRVGWVTVTGSYMPAWEDQHPKLKDAWEAAAQAVARIIGGENG